MNLELDSEVSSLLRVQDPAQGALSEQSNSVGNRSAGHTPRWASGGSNSLLGRKTSNPTGPSTDTDLPSSEAVFHGAELWTENMEHVAERETVTFNDKGSKVLASQPDAAILKNGKKRWQRRWSNEGEAQLVTLRADGMSFGAIAAQLLGRTARACRNHYIQMLQTGRLCVEGGQGVLKSPPKNGKRWRRHWSNEEEAQLVTLRADGMSFDAIATQLGRNAKGCHYHHRWMLQTGRLREEGGRWLLKSSPKL